MMIPRTVRRFGWKPSLPDGRDIVFQAIHVPLPDKTDLEPNMPPIYDQGSYGSCTANAGARVFQFDLMKQGISSFMPSRFFIYWNERFLDGTTNYDSGSTLRDCAKVLNNVGVCPESMWDYEDAHFLPKPDEKCFSEGLKNTSVLYQSVPQTETTIKQVLSLGYPIMFGISVYESFEDDGPASTGIIPMPHFTERVVGGHAIVLAGYDDSTKLFKFANSWGCYDDKTEVLTNGGWKLFKDVVSGDKIATLNPKNNNIEYQFASHYHEYPFDGLLHCYISDYVDLAVTPNHNMFIGNYRSGVWGTIKSEDITNKYIKFKKNGNWVGVESEFKKIGDQYIKMDDWVEFIGYFLSEGSVTHYESRRTRTRKRKYMAGIGIDRNVDTGRFMRGSGELTERTTIVHENYIEHYRQVAIHQTKPKNIPIISACLSRLPFTFTKHNGKSWFNTCVDLHEELIGFGKQSNRFIPKEILDLSKRQLTILYEAMMLGDGTICGGKRCYYTSSKQMADDFQELCLKIGKCADIAIVDRRGLKNSQGYNYNELEYQVKIKEKRTTPSFSNKVEKMPYNGTVYCLTVPNHIMYVRRNGKAVWCGNSGWGSRGYGYLPYDYVLDPRLASDFWVIKTVK